MARTIIHYLSGLVVTLTLLSGAPYTLGAPGDSDWQNNSPLKGRVLSASGAPLAGIPVRAEREVTPGDNAVVTVIAYTGGQGRYAYHDLPAGRYKVGIDTPGFDATKLQTLEIKTGASKSLDLTLTPHKPGLDDVTAAELLNALPGTEAQKARFSGCSNCHSLKFVWQQNTRTRDEWFATIERMRVKNNDSGVFPEEMHKAILDRTREENNKLADYIAETHGNNASLNYNLLPRPTGDASTQIEITEYALKRGATTPVVFRGDPTGPWLHDVMPDPNNRFVWYTDHFSNLLGRLDPETGEIVEYEYPQAKPDRSGGSHGIQIDREGKIYIGTLWQGAITKFDPVTEEFTQWPVEDTSVATERLGIFGLDYSSGIITVGSSPTSSLFRLDPRTGEYTHLPLPDKRGVYGVGTDSRGLVYYCQLNGERIGQYDPGSKTFKVWKTPTPDSGPRRLDIDADDRLWFGEFFAGNLGMFDPRTETIHEWPVPAGHANAAPYDVSVDNLNKTVWTHDFVNERLYRFDMNTEQFTEFLLPLDVEIRHLFVDSTTTPVTVWVPDYTPPGRLLRLKVW